MNPFAEDSQFDPRLYEAISRIRKKSDKTKASGLKDLDEMMESIDLEGNMDMIVDVITDTISSQNVQIMNRAIDILYKLLSRTEDRSLFRRILARWLYGFIENPSYPTSQKIFNRFVDIQELEDEFVKLLDFNENPTLGLVCLFLLIKKGKNDYSKVFIGSIQYLRLGSTSELNEVYRICELIGGNDELYSRIVRIRGGGLMNMKWKILLDIFNSVPECITNDGKYLNAEILSRAIERLDHCDDIVVKNLDSLRVILPRVENRNEYLKTYLTHGSIEDMCIFEFCTGINLLNEIDVDIGNRLIKNVLIKHFDDVQEINERISRLIVRNESNSTHDINEREEFRHDCSSADLNDEVVFKRLVSSLDGLSGREMIRRGDILGMHLNPSDFTREEVEEMFPHSVNVFPKDYMLNQSFHCDLIPLLLKYPDDMGEDRIKQVITKENLHLFIPVCHDLDLLRSLIFIHDDNTLLMIYSSTTMPPALDLDAYYRLRTRIDAPRMVDYTRIIQMYLDVTFIEDLINGGVIDRLELYEAVLLHLSSLRISMNTSYTNPFYDTDRCFYKDIKLREENEMILRLREVYSHVYNEPEEIFLLLLLDSMNGDEDDRLDMLLRSRGIENKSELYDVLLKNDVILDNIRKIDLKENQHFVEKIFFDLGLPSRRCGEEGIEELLRSGGFHAIDYILRNHDVPPQFISFVDFSYLSNAALSNVVSILDSAFGSRSSVEFTESSSEYHVDDAALISLINSDFRNRRGLELSDLLRMIERDQLLSMKEFHRKRYNIYSVLLKNIYRRTADSVFNMYSVSKLDLDSVDEEVYDLLRECFYESKVLFWDLMLNSLHLIRNVSINSFFEKMVGEKEEWRIFLESASIAQKSLFAFIFPSLFSTLPRMEVFMDPLIMEEASKNVMDVVAKTQKLTNGFNIRITYTTSDTSFSALIIIPLDYPYEKPTFSSDMGRRNLLNLKINEMIKKNSKFMELIGLWKVNIDEKISGHRECPVCYFILDTHDSSFPISQCESCKNRFHPRCIVKWIANGTRNTCPICRRQIDTMDPKSKSFICFE